MSSYTISRPWFDFAFENPSKVTMAHNALMFALIEINNRVGWKKEFGVTAKECMELMGCRSYNTYKSCLNDLIEFGFVTLVKKSANQYQCNVIALSKYDKPLDKALDKALTNHSINQSESIRQSTGDIPKQQTTNQKQREQPPFDSDIDIDSIKNQVAGELKDEKEAKIKYREAVNLTMAEYTKLLEGHGMEKTDWMLDKLNSFKLSNGKKYNSDYHAVLTWVIKAAEEGFAPKQAAKRMVM